MPRTYFFISRLVLKSISFLLFQARRNRVFNNNNSLRFFNPVGNGLNVAEDDLESFLGDLFEVYLTCQQGKDLIDRLVSAIFRSMDQAIPFTNLEEEIVRILQEDPIERYLREEAECRKVELDDIVEEVADAIPAIIDLTAMKIVMQEQEHIKQLATSGNGYDLPPVNIALLQEGRQRYQDQEKRRMRSDEGARRQQFNNRRDLLKRVFKEGIRGSPSSSQELRQLLQPQQQEHLQRSRIILPQQQQQQQQRSKIILPQQQQQQELQRPQIIGQDAIFSIPQQQQQQHQQHQRAQIMLPQAGRQAQIAPQGGIIPQQQQQQQQQQQVVVPQLVRSDPIMPPPPPTPTKEPSALQQPSVIVQQVNPPSSSDGVMATLQEVLNEGADAMFPSTQVRLVNNSFLSYL